MRWVADNTGRFPSRPHYEPLELDFECERLVVQFCQNKYGRLKLPFSTDDLTILIENHSTDLDVYADLSSEGPNVEGATYFHPINKPVVKISKVLSEDESMFNRFRSTLAHEMGHVKFHTFLWTSDKRMRFSNFSSGMAVVCRGENIITTVVKDWMEWQASYASGALLMPINGVKSLVTNFRSYSGIQKALVDGSPESLELIIKMTITFQVSNIAATVRLKQLGFLTEGVKNVPLFST